MSPLQMIEGPDEIQRDVEAVACIDAVPALLKFICQTTGMGLAAVARVSDDLWTVCAIQDTLGMGLEPGTSLDVNTTLCKESRASRQAIFVDKVSADPDFCKHPGPVMYKIESYITVPIVRQDGKYFGNLCAIDPQARKVSDLQTRAMFSIFADLIAMQLDSEDRLQAANVARLDEKASSDLRDQFIAVLGHDLRNPLSAVSTTAELLIRRPEPDVVRLGTRLKTTTRRMAKLIDDVLDFARGRLGTGIGMVMAMEAEMAQAFLDVVDELRQAHPGREIHTNFLMLQPLLCDRSRLQQLLSNLVGNALAYGSTDTPITISAVLVDGSLFLTVANGGEPIKPENLSQVFKPYWRPNTSKPGGGLGLGLYICIEIAKAHGGKMEVTSSTEAGTVFGARLPIVASLPSIV